MKKLLMALCVLSVMAVANVAPAQDMAKLTCAEFTAASIEHRTMLLFWVDGYLSSESDNTVMDDEWIETLGKHLVSYCAQNPPKTIMDAIEALPE